MRALTVCQPYAHLIATGEKWVENRRWPTDYRGPLLIHAGQSRSWLGPDDEAKYPGMAYGAIVAVCELVDCLRPVDISAQAGTGDPVYRSLDDHEHTEGPWCWVLRNVRALTPRKWRGAQGLWIASDGELRAAYGAELDGMLGVED